MASRIHYDDEGDICKKCYIKELRNYENYVLRWFVLVDNINPIIAKDNIFEGIKAEY